VNNATSATGRDAREATAPVVGVYRSDIERHQPTIPQDLPSVARVISLERPLALLAGSIKHCVTEHRHSLNPPV
jgi:hypothetical protein